jgi:hypothetical protein
MELLHHAGDPSAPARVLVAGQEATDPAAAHDMLEKLPLGQAHLMSFELIPLAPLNPLRQLQGMSTRQP